MQDITISLPHITLAGLESGSPKDIPILAVHGWLDNAASFVPLIEHLSGRLPDLYVVAIDQAGHGLSDHRPPGANYHQMDYVQDIFELIETKGWQKVHLLGHSMGGIISSLFAATYPDKVASLVMMEAFGALTKPADTSTAQLRESIESRHRLMHSDVRHPVSLDAAVKARLKAGGMTEAGARLLMQRNLTEEDGTVKWRTDRRLRSVSSLRLTDDQARAFVAGIKCPTLAMLGEDGYERTRTLVNTRRELVDDLKVVTLSGGHHLHLDNPADVAAALQSFYQTL
ncbi:alpha/beta fold hydrolase [Aestuariibacter salexigens]|uniref:alpha/beta fold hydrolase n=1 Tax=Aestuariibacter salexigens TaxID=226010 RepID=UPI0003FBFD3E|nr:alpha/beta hydrolase [Aestuariibacter salexigens]